MTDISIICLGMTTCYLLKSRKGYFLIDTGFKHFSGKFIEQLNAKNISINDIRYILLTHHHQDHAGLLNYIVNKNPEIRVIMHEKCIPLVDKGTNNITRKTIFSTKRIRTLFMLAKRMMRYVDARCPYSIRKNDIIIKDDGNKLLEDIGIDGIVLHTPGHTEDSISVYIEKYGIFCGDAAVNKYGYTGNRYLPILLDDIELLYKSWKTITATGAKIVFPAHGNSFDISMLEKNIYMHSRKKHVKVLS